MTRFVFSLVALGWLALSPSIATAADARAVFAGGCFWCMEAEFEGTDGVSSVVSGYAGAGDTAPTYEEVSTGRSGFIEAVEVFYDPAKVGYDDLLKIYWSNVDPFDAEGQFCDKGSQYVAAIFTDGAAEEKLARESLERVERKYGRPVATAIQPLEKFYPAEDHHQDYAKKNRVRYTLYKNGCGRPDRLEELKSMKTQPEGASAEEDKR